MARPVPKNLRVYMNGHDMSGYARDIGPLTWKYQELDATVLTDAVKVMLTGQPEISPGTYNGVLDNTTAETTHPIIGAGNGAPDYVMAVIGSASTAVAGDPVFGGYFQQTGYYVEGKDVVGVTIPFSNRGVDIPAVYDNPWGVLLHASIATTAANTAIGIDDYGAATSLGGYMAYQLLTSDNNVTISVQDAATNLNASFADITGMTTGAIRAFANNRKAGIITLARTATVRRYLRWQIDMGSATTATFVLAFCRETRY